MGFKLGKSRGNYAVNGIIKTKLRFGQEAGGEASIPGTPVIRKNLAEGVLGEANMDGSIYISNKVIPGSKEEKQVINHEMRHATDMKIGKLAYGDDFVKYNGKTYPRKDGKIKYNGKFHEEGSMVFPWEQRAKKAE